jgi:hypothetical protein
MDPTGGTDTDGSSARNVFIVRLDIDGDYLGKSVIADGSANNAFDAKVDSAGNTYITGDYNGTIDFDLGAGTANRTASGSSNGFTLKYDAAGAFQWVVTSGTANFSGNSLGIDADSKVYIGGSFTGTKDFNFGAGTQNKTAGGSRDGYLLQLDSSGNFSWVQTWSGSAGSVSEVRYGIKQNSVGDIIISGYFTGSTIDFDPSSGTAIYSAGTGEDLFLASYETDSTFNWVKTLGNSNTVYATNFPSNFAFDSDDNIYWMGSFYNTLDFDAGAGVDNHTSSSNASATTGNPFIVSYDVSGNYIDGATFGNFDGDAVGGLTVSGNRLFAVSTNFYGIDYEPGLGVDWYYSQESYVQDVALSSYTINGSGDTTPPLRTDGTPYVSLRHGTTSSNLTLTTDESATCKYDTTIETPYASMSGTFDTTGGTSHSEPISGLVDDTTYTYYIRCQDSAGNPNTYEYPITFFVEHDGGETVEYRRTYNLPDWNDQTEDRWLLNTTSDTVGNLYVFGKMESPNNDFDPGPDWSVIDRPDNVIEYFISRYNTSGAYQWTGVVPTALTIINMGTDVDNNFYVVGKAAAGTTDFDLTGGTDSQTLSNATLFISKYDEDGNYIETNFVVNASTLNFLVATVDADGSTYFTGSFTGAVDFDPGAGTETLNAGAGPSRGFFVKYNTSGGLEWAEDIGGYFAYPLALSADNAGNIYATGGFGNDGSTPVDFDPGAGVDGRVEVGSNDIYLASYNASTGAYQWVRTAGGTGYEAGQGVKADAAGHVYIEGYFDSATADFDGTSGTDNQSGDGTASGDAFLSSYDTDGSYNWTRAISGPGYEDTLSYEYDYEPGHITADAAGNVYLTGTFEGTVDFDHTGGTDNRVSNGGYDIFLVGYEPDGDSLVISTTGGATSDDYGMGLVAILDRLYLVGSYYTSFSFNSIDFDPSTGVDENDTSFEGTQLFDYFLSTYEIPYTPPPSDTTPPVRSAGAPTGSLASGTTSTNLTLTTDENATCRYSATAGTAYGSMSNTFGTTGTTSHSQNLTGLTDGTTYTYYVRCIDTATNANTDDYTISFSVASPGDTTPPVISNGQPSGSLTSGTTTTNLSVDTDENATCRYSATAGTAYSSMTDTFGTTGITSHSQSLAGLTDGTSYTYYVRCVDGASNVNTSDYTVTFAVGVTPVVPVVEEDPGNPDDPALDTPDHFSALCTPGGIQLTWQDESKGEEGYAIFRKFGEESYAQIKKVKKNTEVYLDTFELQQGAIYSYKVRAYTDDEKGEFSRSQQVAFACQPEEVVAVVADPDPENDTPVVQETPIAISPSIPAVETLETPENVLADITTVQQQENKNRSSLLEKLLPESLLFLALLPLVASILLQIPFREALRYLPFMGGTKIFPALKKSRKYGIVFDAETGKPLVGSQVTVLAADDRKQSVMVNGAGMYTFLVPLGKYILRVEKDGYQMAPSSQNIIAYTQDRKIYRGEDIVLSGPGAINYDVPMSRIQSGAKKISSKVGIYRMNEKVFIFLSHIFFYGGFFLTIFMTFIAPSMLQYVLLGMYSLVLYFDITGIVQAKWGEVTLVKDNRRAAFASLKLFGPDEALRARTLSDEYGRYYIFSEKGQFSLLTEFTDSSTGNVFQEKQKVSVREKFGCLTKNIKLNS